MNILVTGYNGFVGKNLIYNLKNNKSLKIFTFGKENNYQDLVTLVNKSNLIFHLAGENRNHSSKEFIKNNLQLTKKIVEIIKKKNKKTYLIFSSTNQISKKKISIQKLNYLLKKC